MPGSARTRERLRNASANAPLEITPCVFDGVFLVHANNTRAGGRLKIRAADLLGEITRLGFYFYASLSVVCEVLWLVKVAGCGIWLLINQLILVCIYFRL